MYNTCKTLDQILYETAQDLTYNPNGKNYSEYKLINPLSHSDMPRYLWRTYTKCQSVSLTQPQMGPMSSWIKTSTLWYHKTRLLFDHLSNTYTKTNILRYKPEREILVHFWGRHFEDQFYWRFILVIRMCNRVIVLETVYKLSAA